MQSEMVVLKLFLMYFVAFSLCPANGAELFSLSSTLLIVAFSLCSAFFGISSDTVAKTLYVGICMGSATV